jgi:enamine deaminase RidA (YjgF/YER057c/UK114 family)
MPISTHSAHNEAALPTVLRSLKGCSNAKAGQEVTMRHGDQPIHKDRPSDSFRKTTGHFDRQFRGESNMSQREPVFPENRNALYDAHRYSAAIRSGDFLFVSGQVGSRADGSPEPDQAAQIRLAFDNLGAVLAAAGASFDDVIDVTTFHIDPENQFEQMMHVKDEVFATRPYPNWTAVGVNWLAGFDFEIKVIARIANRELK